MQHSILILVCLICKQGIEWIDLSSYYRIVPSLPILILENRCRHQWLKLGKLQANANGYKPGSFATYKSCAQRASDKLIPTIIRSAENTDNTFMV